MDCNRRHAASRRTLDLHRAVVGGPRRSLGRSLRLARHHRARFAQARGLRQQGPAHGLRRWCCHWSPSTVRPSATGPRGSGRQSFQCFSGNRFEWVVHGLWPQNQARSGRDHPRNCEAAGAVPASVLKAASVHDAGRGADAGDEWQAHGTRLARSPNAISRTSGCVRHCIAPPCVTWRARAPTCPGCHSPTAGTSSRPSCGSTRRCRRAACASAWPRTTGSGELWVCLGKDLKPMACPTRGTPDGQRIKIRTPMQ